MTSFQLNLFTGLHPSENIKRRCDKVKHERKIEMISIKETLKFMSVGKYIGIQPNQLIRLKNLTHIAITTPAKAVEEAIQFCIDNNLAECELDYDGFLFDIEPTSDLRTKLKDYYRARAKS